MTNHFRITPKPKNQLHLIVLLLQATAQQKLNQNNQMGKALLSIIYQNSAQWKKLVIQKIAGTDCPPKLASEQEGFAYQMHLDQTTGFLNFPINIILNKLEK